LSRTPRRHLIWFVGEGIFSVDYSKASEVFIDATFSVSRAKVHLYAIVAEEIGYGVPLGFMLMEIHDKEDCRTKEHKGEALDCNRDFFQAAKELGINPAFVHTDKDFSELTAVCHHKVRGSSFDLVESFSW
jgi:hypothetical protein